MLFPTGFVCISLFNLASVVLIIRISNTDTNHSGYLCFHVYDHNIHNMIDLAKISGFDWDVGNTRKNEKHCVSMAESEQVFFNTPLLVLGDSRHSSREIRFHALGKSDSERLMHITFTLRDDKQKIRVISARDMHIKERKIYEKAT